MCMLYVQHAVGVVAGASSTWTLCWTTSEARKRFDGTTWQVYQTCDAQIFAHCKKKGGKQRPHSHNAGCKHATAQAHRTVPVSEQPPHAVLSAHNAVSLEASH